jgi:hypothetical protein
MLMHNFSLRDEVLPCIFVRVGDIKIQIILKFLKRFEKGEFLIFLSLSGQILSCPTIFLFFLSFLPVEPTPPQPSPPHSRAQPRSGLSQIVTFPASNNELEQGIFFPNPKIPTKSNPSQIRGA